MAEAIHIPKQANRAELYKALYPQFKAVVDGEEDLIANMANAAAILKEAFNFFWVGFYLVKNNTLVLGPFQGPLACTRIAKGKGVCGASWKEERAFLVPDVTLFPGHIACNSASKSEVVVPLFDKNNEVFAVLDVDSDKLNDFSELDIEWLQRYLVHIKQ